MNKTNILYVIKHEYNNLYTYKIGITKNLKTRISNLNTSCPGNLTVFESFNFKENIKSIENFIHNKFKNKKIKGEWFMLDNDDLFNIKNIIEEYKTSLTHKVSQNRKQILSQKYIQKNIPNYNPYEDKSFFKNLENYDIINCEIYRITSLMKEYIIIIGLNEISNKPILVFGFSTQDIHTPFRAKSAKLVKNKQQNFDLHYNKVIIENIQNYMSDEIIEFISGLTSLFLSNSNNINQLIEFLNNSIIHQSFCKAVARTLKRYNGSKNSYISYQLKSKQYVTN